MMHPLTRALDSECSFDTSPDVQVTRRVPISVSRLPPELWEHVIDQLWDDHPTLWECSLTCRAWVPITRYHLFNHIEFHSKSECLYFQAALDSSEIAGTNIARYVRHVAIVGMALCRLGVQYDDGNALLLHHILVRLPDVDNLLLENVDLDVYLPPLDYADGGVELHSFSHLFPLPDLRRLRLSSVMFHSIHDIRRMIAAFPRLSVLVIERALWWQDNNNPLLWVEEGQDAQRTLKTLTCLSLLTLPSPLDVLRRIQRFPSLQSTRQFGWTAYVADEKRLFLRLLHDYAPNLRALHLVTRYDSDLFSELDGRQYSNVRNVRLMLAASTHNRHAFCASLPSFLTRLDTMNLRTLTLGFSLFRPTDMYWTFVDWTALDSVLLLLHTRNPRVTVIFRISFVPAAGLSDDLTADVAGPLMEYLPGALGSKLRIGVRCDLFDTMAGVALRQGTLRWLSSGGVS